MTGVLDGLRVLDLSRGLAGSLAGVYLSDQGAEVIKVEPPGATRPVRYRRRECGTAARRV